LAGIAALLLLAAACGGGTDSQAPVLPPAIAISPALVTTTVGAEFTFTASVVRAADPRLTWSALRGTITQDGAYSAPSTQGEDMVTAALTADSSVSATARVVVSPPPVVSMAISPLEPTITVGSTRLFIARVLGGDSSAVSWTLEVPDNAPVVANPGGIIDKGSLDQDGLYTAPTALPKTPNLNDPDLRYESYPFKIVATTQASGKQVTASTTVTVTTKPVPNVAIVDGSSNSPSPVVNGEIRYFHALLTGVSLVEVSWSVEAVDPLPDANSLPMPTVTPTGESTQFTGSERPGLYRLRATVKDRATGAFITETSHLVNVLVVYVCVTAGNPPTESDGITPTPCRSDSASTTPAMTLPARGSQQFSATVTTNNGATDATYIASNPATLSWMWSVQETTGGSIVLGTGLYTAPVRGGTYHVKATVNQYTQLRSASAAVLVNGVKVTIDPLATEVRAGSSVDLTATVTDVVSADGNVTWLIQEGSAGGTYTAFPSTPTSATSATSRATYTAPSTGGGKTYHVIATSTADSSVRATATIRVLGVWTSVAAGDHHTVGVKSDGTLWAWGNNYYGQLGDGTTINRLRPVRIGAEQNWVSVSAGADYTVAIKNEGQGRSLYAWGANAYGQLGDGTFTDRNAPVRIGVNFEWTAVSARGHHTVAIKHDGTLWAWGDNTFGQVGDGGGTVQPVRTEIIARDQNGTAFPLRWSTVSAGTGHTLAIATNGMLWAWGRNDAGQLGVNDTNPRLVPARVGSDNDWLDVDGGGAHSVGIRRSAVGATQGNLWVWGDNSERQLGGASGTSSLVPIQLGLDTTWVRVFAGESHTMAVNANQTLWGWGRNARGELGLAQSTSGIEPTPVQLGNQNNRLFFSADSGFAHTVLLTADGRLLVSGANASGEVGNGDVAAKVAPVQVSGAVTNWADASLAAGWDHSAAITSGGALWTWGSNAYGQLGDGTRVDRDVPVQIPAGAGLTWQTVSAGEAHTVAIRSDGRVFTWGDNSLGQLGRALGANGERCPAAPSLCGAPTSGEIPQFLGFDPWVGVAAGASHTVAITRDGSLWAWGNNEFGQVGNGAASIREPVPVLVERYLSTPYGGPSRKWIAVAAAGDHTLGIKELYDGSVRTFTVWAWGRNDVGQVGDGTQGSRSSPVQIGTAVNWRSVSAGFHHSFATNSMGELWRWGSNLAGQLGIGPDPIALAPVRSDAASWTSAWGGGSHSVGIMQDGTLWTWGRNNAGQLGNGTTVDRLIPVQIGVGSTWATAAAGLGHTLAVRSGGSLWAWGNNDVGQLGDGTAWIDVPIEVN
jgi:alpha-tubulin suppressor-like RCC1 family protein